MNQDVSHIEIGAIQAGVAGAFLSQLFGWTYHPMGEEGEGWLEAPSLKIGIHGNDPSLQMHVYFKVTDIEAAVVQVKALGGETEKIVDEPGFGRFCNCRDPQGIRFGLHQRGV